MSEQVKTKTISLKSIVDKLDPDRKKRKVEYLFSNGRKFIERGVKYQ